MTQMIQYFRTGTISTRERPDPAIGDHEVLVAGTERCVVDLARKSLLSKAPDRPDNLTGFLQKVREEGLRNNWDAPQLCQAVPIDDES